MSGPRYCSTGLSQQDGFRKLSRFGPKFAVTLMGQVGTHSLLDSGEVPRPLGRFARPLVPFWPRRPVMRLARESANIVRQTVTDCDSETWVLHGDYLHRSVLAVARRVNRWASELRIRHEAFQDSRGFSAGRRYANRRDYTSAGSGTGCQSAVVTSAILSSPAHSRQKRFGT